MSRSDAVVAAEREGKNFIAEYFGHRVYPEVVATDDATRDQHGQLCPFLTSARTTETACVKRPSSKGVCVVSTMIDHDRFDWLVCPNRALDPTFMGQAARRIFGYPDDSELSFIAAPTLALDETRTKVHSALAAGVKVVVYFQEKLGGELGISKTETSPEFSFDWTLIEITAITPRLGMGRFGILEIQTMDFHGSYAHAVARVDEHRLDPSFHRWLGSAHGRVALSRNMEGPNLSNVFKRTFYQMAYKFAIAGHGNCAGAGFAIPQSVWTSWLRHLANPVLIDNGDGTHSLGDAASAQSNAWIFVFELDPDTSVSPRPLIPYRQIRIDTEELVRLALVESPTTALAPGGPVDAVEDKVRARVRKLWPGIA